MATHKARTTAKRRKGFIPQRDYKSLTGYRSVIKDPILAHVLRVWDMAKENGLTYAKLEETSGVTRTTILAWEYGKTRRPHRLTMEFVLRACGPYTMGVIDTSTGKRLFEDD